MKRQPGFTRFVALAVLILSLLLANATAADRTYAYPYANPILATSTFALLESQHEQRAGTYVELPILPGRQEVPHLQEHGRLGVLLYTQASRAPLVFIVPGLGGYSLDNAPQWLAEQFFERGFHVIALPSAFNWRFAIAASTTGRPGVTRMDALDLKRVMQKALNHWKENVRKPIESVGLLGYSLGGLQAGFVARAWRAEEMGFPLQHVLLINPPVDLRHSITKLDEFYEVHSQWRQKKAQHLEGDLTGAAILYLKNHDIKEPGYFEDLDEEFDFSRDELKFGIGLRFRHALSEVIFASQQVHDLGILDAPVNPPRFVARLAEAAQFGFRDYYRRFLLPYTAEKNADQLFQENGLRAIEDFLRNNEAIFLMHNVDDFLLKPGDIDHLERVFGRRAIIYPKGGHLGNLWFPENLRDIIGTFEGSHPSDKRRTER